MKVSSASTIPLKTFGGLSSAGARRNRCRQRKAVVGGTPHSCAVFAKNASLYFRDLRGGQVGGGLIYLFNDRVERFGPVEDCEVRVRHRPLKK